MLNISVSIFMLTYNQEDFIVQTIEGVLKQQTSFVYQLVIGEDCSNDSTRKICEDFAKRYPDKIKLLASNQRHGLIKNFMRTLKECDGKYIAVCDGDDYWTDPHKLQKQYDFLESHPNHSIVYTGIRNLYPSGEFRKKEWSHIEFPSYFEDLIFGNFIPSVTAFYRNKKEEEKWPEWILNFPYGDWPVYLFLTRNGEKIGYIDEITGVYRKEIGVSEKLKKTSSDIAKVNLDILQYVYKDINFQNNSEHVYKSLQKHKFGLLGSYFREGKYVKSLNVAIGLTRKNPARVIKTYAYLSKRKVIKLLVK